jgi:AcrR family transcriptional regulator
VSEFAFASGAATPRKRPVQERSQATVTAILDATIRVLREDGPDLTTTRVAEVAGVSVGTLYQYFPNREALLHGVLADHLEIAVTAVETAIEETRGLRQREAAERVVRAFLTAKAGRVEITRLLDQVFGVGKLDDRPMVTAALRRAEIAVASLLGDTDLSRANVVCSALEGVVRSAILDDPDRLTDPTWADHVVALVINAFPA